MANNLGRKYQNCKKQMKENALKLIREFLHSVTFLRFAMCGILEYKIVCHYKHKTKIQISN